MIIKSEKFSLSLIASMLLEGNKILFISSDPGGAKQLLALSQLYMNQKSISYISDRNYDFYEDFDISVEVIKLENIENLISYNRPSLIITGTSYTSELELRTIKICRELNIKVFSLVDNWSNFTTRFTLKGELLLPDKIYVLDKSAKINATNEYIPDDIIEILPFNPYLKFLSNWKPSFSKSQLFNLHGLDDTRELMYYVPDPLSNVGGVGKYGFDEVSAAWDIYFMFKSFNFIWKLHPNQNPEVIKEFKNTNIKFISDNQHHNHFLHYSNTVISFFSNALIEAKILGSKPVRYLKGLTVPDPFEDKSIQILFT